MTFPRPLSTDTSSASSLTSISKSCFEAMQSEMSLALTLPYHVEEKEHIESALGKVDNLIAIGCSYLRYAETALHRCRSYTAIEPSLTESFSANDIAYLKDARGINIVPKGFDDVEEADLGDKGRRLFFFLFNVFPYIGDAAATLKKLMRPDDIAVVSAWNNHNDEARQLQKVYYDYLRSQFNCVLTPKGNNSYLDMLEQNQSSVYRAKGKITDILTIRAL